MKLLITGATGLIGREIVKLCIDKGWQLNYLSRTTNVLDEKEGVSEFLWDVEKGEIDLRCFDGVQAIINLAGATIAQRWTEKNKEKIVNSRIESLRLLKKSIPKDHSIKHIISASAIGIYPDSETHYYDESAQEISDTFLGDVVKQWEEAVDSFADLGLKVSKLRIGLVLAKDGGALPKIAKPIDNYVGAAFGSGDQWQSWIHLRDLAELFLHIAKFQLEGIYNGVAPNPVTNSHLTKEIADLLNKPLILPNIPRLMMKMILGEMHILLFESQRVSSKKIENSGFHFKYPNLRPALSDILK